jgi:pimeloyl-ACP methyl ester carboxylesterase
MKIILTYFLTLLLSLPANAPSSSSITYRGGNKAEYIQQGVIFDDAYFDGSSGDYNHSLARLSMLVSAAAFSTTASDIYWGEQGQTQSDTYGRDDNIKNVFSGFNFDDYTPYNYNVSLNDSSSKAAFAIAHRDGLLAVAVRGGGYGAEWADNFNVGNGGGYHLGFYGASEEVVAEIAAYIDKYQIKAPFKIWIMGFSRGGAVANIAAATLNAVYGAENVYAYTFASPNTVIGGEAYDNIFNIVNPSDVVPAVPLTEWGFSRYGKVISLPETSLFKGKIHNISDVLYGLAPSAAEWEGKWQKVISGYLLLLNTRRENGAGSWEASDITLQFIDTFGQGNLTVFHQVSIIVSILSGYDSELLSHVNVFVSLCKMYGVDTRALLTNIQNVITTVEFLRASSSLYIDYKNESGLESAHLPEMYIKWLHENQIEYAGNQ